MKKRIVSLLLIAVMLLLGLTACAEKTAEDVKRGIGEKASKNAKTLSMYLMSETEVDSEQIEVMEEAVNKITEKEFNVHLELNYEKPEKYFKVIEENLEKMKNSDGTDPKPQKAPTYIDETNGQPKVEYPLIQEFDVDIFYIGGDDKRSGYDRYTDYVGNGYLAKMDNELKHASKSLKAAISGTILDSFVAANKDIYAIPTNRMIGEYTYLLLNKDALQVTEKSADDITSLTDEDCQDMLALISAEHRKDFFPLYSSEGKLDLTAVKSFAVDEKNMFTNEFSLLCGAYDTSWKGDSVGQYPVMDWIFNANNTEINTNDNVLTQISVLKNYDFQGYYNTKEDVGKDFAVGYIKGGLDAVDEYKDDYVIKVIQNPTVTQKDIYESMFAVTAKSNDVALSAKILTYLNTNEEFRNLILYGVEGVNYKWINSGILDENGKEYQVVERQTADPKKRYIMDAVKTGNVALAYPSARDVYGEGNDPIMIKQIGNHNNDLIIESAVAFNIAEGVKSTVAGKRISKESAEALQSLSALSAETYERILAADSPDVLNDIFEDVKITVADRKYACIMSGEDSVASYYKSWLVSKKLAAAS